MNKNNVIELAIKNLESKLDSLESSIQSEEKEKREAPSAMQSWSDNTRFEKEVLIRRLEEEKEKVKKHIKFLQSLALDSSKKTKVEQGVLIEVENLEIGKTNFYFVSLFAGLSLKIQGIEVIFLSQDSPLIKSLLNKKQGHKVKVEINSFKQELKISSVK